MSYKHGFLKKSSDGKGWDDRFFVLTNAGLVYWDKKEFKTLDDYTKCMFKPLESFLLRIPQDAGYKLEIRFVKNKARKEGEKNTKVWILDCLDEKEQSEWFVALKRYQLESFCAKSNAFKEAIHAIDSKN